MWHQCLICAIIHSQDITKNKVSWEFWIPLGPVCYAHSALFDCACVRLRPCIVDIVPGDRNAAATPVPTRASSTSRRRRRTLLYRSQSCRSIIRPRRRRRWWWSNGAAATSAGQPSRTLSTAGRGCRPCHRPPRLKYVNNGNGFRVARGQVPVICVYPAPRAH
jgi:hypothetical protein